MKTGILHRLISTRKAGFALLFVSGLFLTSCVVVDDRDWHGYSGRPGNAYISLNWENEYPDYLDAGTGAIPSVFDWGTFYRINPGYYTLYYEGDYWNGWRYIGYAFEMDYEIWILAGEPGGYHYNGADAPNTYFSLILSPYGPDIYLEESYYKKPAPEMPEIGRSFTKMYEKDGLGIKITYKRVEKTTKVKENSATTK